MSTTLRRLAVMITLAGGLACQVLGTDGSWTNNANGTWSVSNNWADGAVADGVGATAWFTNNITAARTITVDTNSRTLGGLTIGDPVSPYFAFTLVANGGATLTFSPTNGNAQLNQPVTAAAQTIGVPLVLTASLDVNNAATNTLTLTNGVTGTGNLTFNATGAGGITFASMPITAVGTLTNLGSGAGVATISGGVGSNVVAVIENSTNSALTIGTAALTVNSGGTILANNNVGGARVLTVSGGVVGQGSLMLNNNSAIPGGITLAAGTINPAGMLTNAGVGPGASVVTAVIGTNVMGVVQNSAGSMLILSGANTYAGATTVASGTLLVTNTAGSATGTGAVNVNSNGVLQGKGRLYGPVALNPGGRVAPGLDGSAGGTLTLSNLTWYGGGVITFEVAALTNGVGGAGIDYDQVVVNNGLTGVSNGAPLIVRPDTLGQNLSGTFQSASNYALKVLACAGPLTLNGADLVLDTNAFLVGGDWAVTNANNALYVVHRGVVDANYWVGTGALTNWSGASNWSKGHVPQPGEDVVFDWASTANCQADVVSNNLHSLTLADGYGGTVTFSKNAVATGMTLAVTGDIVLQTGNLVFMCDTAAQGAGTPTVKFGVGYTLIASNLAIAAGASLNSDAMGFALGAGPSGVTGAHLNWGSPSHGGQGGVPASSPADLTHRAPTYDVARGPTALGCGQAVNDSDNNPGGGALKIVVGAAVTVNGRLSADASNRFPGNRGAGSGGSIWIAKGILQGNGLISAKGTTVSSYEYGSGGGGRIDLSDTTNNFVGVIQTGVAQAGWTRGQSGSLLLPATAGSGATMTNFYGTNLVLGSSQTFTRPVTIGSGVMLSLEANTNNNVFAFDSLTIRNGGVVRCLGNAPEVNPSAGGTTNVPCGTGVTIMASNLTIEAGGSLNANGQGYPSGPGYPGAYGGLVTNSLGATYGPLAAPTALGSGGSASRGGATSLLASQGGGAIQLIVYNTLTVDGTNACNAATAAGSGGSLWIDCGSLQGSGVIAADSLPSAGAGGSGGRVHILYATNLFTGRISAYGGGTNAAGRGGAGTILLSDRLSGETNGTLIVDNNLVATNPGVTLLPANALCFAGTPPTLTLDRVLTRANGTLGVPEGKVLAVTTVFSNGASFLAGTNSAVTWVAANDGWIYGNTVFENLIVSNEALKTVRFAAGSTSTVNRLLQLAEAKLLSQNEGEWWYLTVTGSQDVGRVRARDSNASNGLPIVVQGLGSVNLGHNVNWRFPGGSASILLLR